MDGVPVYERLDRTSGIAPDARRSTRSPSSPATCRRSSATRPAGSSRCAPRAAASAGAAWTLGRGSDAAAAGRSAAGGALGRGATLWRSPLGERRSRFLDPVHPDNLHNNGGGLRRRGSSTPARRTRSRDRRAGPSAAPDTTCRTPTSRKLPGRTSGSGWRRAPHRSWQRVWSGATVSQVAGYARRSRSRLDGSEPTCRCRRRPIAG